MTQEEELHMQAAAYANKRKEAYLDYVKKEEKLSEEMIGWIWVAHYEGYRDAWEKAWREGFYDGWKEAGGKTREP